MSDNFVWSDDYSIGIEEIDSQHRRFLALIQEIYGLKQPESKGAVLQNLVEELEKYLIFHTRSEEMLMVLYDYPKKSIQHEEHQKVLKKVGEKIDHLAGNQDNVADLLIFLMKWFINHTTYLDKELGLYIQEKRNR